VARIMIAAVCLVLATMCSARDMMPTIYDDGRSCPGNCDAHVVFAPRENGTRYAFSPASSRGRPSRCISGHQCRICFGENDSSCMLALYRGAGPKAGRFDFTPAFYDRNCSRGDIPQALRTQCASLDRAVARHRYDTAVNCFLTPGHPRCSALIASARAAQQADEPKRRRCLALGETRYNREQTDPRERRTNSCNYSLLRLGGPSSHRWHLLKLAVCRPGTFVDQYGLDCCSLSIRFAAANHDECIKFFPRPR